MSHVMQLFRQYDDETDEMGTYKIIVTFVDEPIAEHMTIIKETDSPMQFAQQLRAFATEIETQTETNWH